MFNQRWITLSFLMILMGLLLGQRAVLVLPIFLLLTIAAGHWWNKRALRDVTYCRRIARKRAFPGETVDVEVMVENAKLLPVPWLRVDDEWPLAVPPTEAQ